MGTYRCSILIDAICLVVLALPTIILWIVGKPFQRGFFCHDTSIRYPFHDSTIPTWALWSYSVLFPLVVISIIQNVLNSESDKPMVWQVYREIRPFLFGALGSQLSVDVAKYSVGRLRPHFFAVCRPVIECDEFTYYEDIKCNPDPTYTDYSLKDARLSFMSGHASLSAFGMIYLALFVWTRLLDTRYSLWRPFVQIVLVSAAFYTSYTRVSDYKHHWSDVLAGFINGAGFAFFAAITIGKLHQPRLASFYVIERNDDTKLLCNPCKKCSQKLRALDHGEERPTQTSSSPV